eukprot:5121537-Amphidinium_carterae.1
MTTPVRHRRARGRIHPIKRKPLRAPVDDDHMTRYKANIAGAVEQTGWWNYDPPDAVQIIQLAAIDTLEATHTPGTAPKASWMHPATWNF